MQKEYNRLKKLKVKIIKKKGEKREKKEKWNKRKTPQNCKGPMQGERLITTVKSVAEYTIYIYTHKQDKNSPTKVEGKSLTWQTKGTKNYFYQNKSN